MFVARALKVILAGLSLLAAQATFAAEPDFALDLDTGGHRAVV